MEKEKIGSVLIIVSLLGLIGTGIHYQLDPEFYWGEYCTRQYGGETICSKNLTYIQKLSNHSDQIRTAFLENISIWL